MDMQEHKAIEGKQKNIVFRVLSGFWKFIKTYLMAIGLFFTVIPLIMAFLLRDVEITSSLDKSRKVDLDPLEKIVLDFKLHDPLTDRSQDPASLFIGQLMGEKKPLSLSLLTKALRRAKDDIRVQGIFVELGAFAANRANITELRRAFLDFKESKKSIHFHVTSPSSLHYYLASVGDSIAISPADQLLLTGPVFQLTYFSEALAKLGIKFDVVRAGKYKSAMEPFVTNAPSQETLEMYGSLEESLAQHFLDNVSSGRKRLPSEVRLWLKKSFYGSKEALKVGIVDEIAFLEHKKKSVKKSFADAVFLSPHEFVLGSENLDLPLMASTSDKIGYIEAFGTIMAQSNPNANTPTITPKSMRKKLDYMIKNEDIKAVVMRVVSPGGSATASDEIWSKVKELAAIKPLVVSMGGVAASGGYYIAAPAQKILASPTTITGSIGVLSGFPKGTGFQEKWGLSFHTISQSDRKNVFDFGSPLTEQDRRVMASMVDEFYATFLSRVAEGRGKTLQEIDAAGQGRVYTGVEAYAKGLVDELGGLKEAFRTAKKLAGLDPKKLYAVSVYEPKPRSALDCLGKEPAKLLECFEKLETYVPDIRESLESKVLRDVSLSSLGRPGLQGFFSTMAQGGPMALWPGAFNPGARCYLRP